MLISLTSITYITIPQLSALTDFITILTSLHYTTELEITCGFGKSVGFIIRHSSSYRSSLFRALKRDVSVPLSSLRRSQSLDDLNISNHPCEYYQSCPDLLDMQSLRNMHPGLHDGLHCNQLYYSTRCHQRYEQNYSIFSSNFIDD